MIREENNTPDRNARSFDEILLEAIDAAFASLGESVKQVICFHLERRYGIRREEIPSRIEEFQEALVGILGTGSRTLENLIVNNLYSRLSLSPEPQGNCTLAEYVRHAKKRMKASFEKKPPWSMDQAPWETTQDRKTCSRQWKNPLTDKGRE